MVEVARRAGRAEGWRPPPPAIAMPSAATTPCLESGAHHRTCGHGDGSRSVRRSLNARIACTAAGVGVRARTGAI